MPNKGELSKGELLEEGFQEFRFSPKPEKHTGGVYIWTIKKGDREIPFYVGKTTRFFGRLDDYFWASPQAPTDFHVGEAIRFFADYFAGHPRVEIVVHYRNAEYPAEQETKLLARFAGQPMVNRMKATSDIERARIRVQEKCREILKEADFELEQREAGLEK